MNLLINSRRLTPADQRNAIVALRRPTTGKRHGFAIRTLSFVSVAEVLRYNVLSRILEALTNRCLGIPLVTYFDDTWVIAVDINCPVGLVFGAPARLGSGDRRDGPNPSQGVFNWCCESLYRAISNR